MTDHAASPERQSWQHLLARLAPLAIIIVLLLAALSIFSDLRELAEAFRTFEWWLIVPVLLLTSWNYGWRFVKWQIYLHELGVRLPAALSLRIYLSGFAMSITPGKVGELLKAVYVRRASGAPVNRTSAVVAAERITDAFAMLILATAGAVQFSYGRTLLVAVAVLGAVGIALLQRPDILSRLLEQLGNLPLVGRAVVHGTAFLNASSALFRPPILLRAVLLGVISWAGECLAFYFVLIGLGLDGSAHMLMVATFILAVSSLAGGASMLPGGLGVAEAGIAGLLVLLVSQDEGMTHSIAAAATIIIRFATLWFAVIIGAIAMLSLERMRFRTSGGEPIQSMKMDAPGGQETEDTAGGNLRPARDGGDR